MSSAIGILDSGVGGLSVVREIRKQLPGADIHYVGDSAWCPYGNKGTDEIRKRVGLIVDYLMASGVSIVVIACNSATIHAIEWLRSVYLVPFVGMEPGVKPACAMTKTGVIGVLATEASIAGEKFHSLVNQNAGGFNVITQPCPKFVDLVEAGILEGSEVDEAIHEYTDNILEKGADVLVLGCTHYPFLEKAIRRIVPEHVSVLDTGEAVARQTERILQGHYGRSGSLMIETSGNPEKLADLLPVLLPEIRDYMINFSMIG